MLALPYGAERVARRFSQGRRLHLVAELSARLLRRAPLALPPLPRLGRPSADGPSPAPPGGAPVARPRPPLPGRRRCHQSWLSTRARHGVLAPRYLLVLPDDNVHTPKHFTAGLAGDLKCADAMPGMAATGFRGFRVLAYHFAPLTAGQIKTRTAQGPAFLGISYANTTAAIKVASRYT